ncbi:MAG: hypothetical protein N2483_09125 [Burkholderiaceae bacterium]|nr:hypothetical protein [Burkholderiaceae bacterium]
MVPFATEFPVPHRFGKAQLVGQTVAWLRGIENSTVLDQYDQQDLDGDYARLRSPVGEELILRALQGPDGPIASGFRHDLPDSEGRIWRTEAVLRRDSPDPGRPGILRLRTQCLAAAPVATLQTPRKPYLLKTMIRDECVSRDGVLDIRDAAITLRDENDGVVLAAEMVAGRASDWLPVLYVSVQHSGRPLLDARSLDRLAYELGGVAHVVVEPSRSFSFRLRDLCEGKNAYGGTVALIQPGRGIVRRFFLGWQIADA